MKKDFSSNILKAIGERQTKLSAVQNEIAELKTKADALKNQLQNYSDIDDIDTYSRLKSQLEVYENRIELLVRNLDNEVHTNNEEQIKAIYDSFVSAVSDIDERCSGELLSMIGKMRESFENAEKEKKDIDILFDKWRDAFSVEPGQYVSPRRSETYVVHHVRHLFDALRQRNISV